MRQMSTFMKAYLVLGIATLVASALMAAQVVIIAPATNYQVLVMTNVFGEGLFEAVLLASMLPSWAILCKRLITVV